MSESCHNYNNEKNLDRRCWSPFATHAITSPLPKDTCSRCDSDDGNGDPEKTNALVSTSVSSSVSVHCSSWNPHSSSALNNCSVHAAAMPELCSCETRYPLDYDVFGTSEPNSETESGDSTIPDKYRTRQEPCAHPNRDGAFPCFHGLNNRTELLPSWFWDLAYSNGNNFKPKRHVHPRDRVVACVDHNLASRLKKIDDDPEDNDKKIDQFSAGNWLINSLKYLRLYPFSKKSSTNQTVYDLKEECLSGREKFIPSLNEDAKSRQHRTHDVKHRSRECNHFTIAKQINGRSQITLWDFLVKK